MNGEKREYRAGDALLAHGFVSVEITYADTLEPGFDDWIRQVLYMRMCHPLTPFMTVFRRKCGPIVPFNKL